MITIRRAKALQKLINESVENLNTLVRVSNQEGLVIEHKQEDFFKDGVNFNLLRTLVKVRPDDIDFK